MNNQTDQERNAREIERIRNGYVTREQSKTERLKELDAKVRRPADVFAYVFGSASSLVFGTGMCLAMKVIGASLNPAVGIVVGLVGMGACVGNYFIHRAWIKSRRAKYADEVLKLCDEALGGEAK